MTAKLSRYYRERIIALWNGGANVSAIVRTLRDEGRVTTRATIRRWIFRWEQDRGLNDDFRRGRPSKFTIEISEYMERRLEDDDETTSVELQRLIAREFGDMIMHVGYVHQCLHKREPCSFSTFFNVSVATNVTARDARVTSRTNFQ